jgi:quercetin dioxygenase-like cupin family protein
MSGIKLEKTGKFAAQFIAVLAVLISSVVWISQTKAIPQAISGSGVSAQLIASQDLPEPVPIKIENGSTINLDATQVLTYKITIAPGGYTGWHQHGGPHMTVVASGTLTYYDPTCTGVVYPAGSSITDPGFDVHLMSNEGNIDAIIYITELMPEDGRLQIDVPVLVNFCNWHGPAQSRDLLK